MQALVRRHDAPLWVRPAIALAFFLVAGCSSQPGTNGGDVINCQDDPRVRTYSPNLSVTSTTGSMKFFLVRSDPAPPAQGTDTWTIRVVDLSGNALPNLSLSVDPFMPDHGHGTSVRAQASANGDGTYTVTPLYLFMPGVWRITFISAPDAGASDSAVFFFCIPG